METTTKISIGVVVGAASILLTVFGVFERVLERAEQRAIRQLVILHSEIDELERDTNHRLELLEAQLRELRQPSNRPQ